MKLLFDLFPVILFFVAFKFAQSAPERAASFVAPVLGAVAVEQAPILVATALAIAASLLQVGWLIGRGRKVEPMLWISLAVIVVFGGATLWLQDEVFIKWKPTILYWLFGGILLAGRVAGRNFVRQLLGTQLALPEREWARLLWAWIAFFAVVGALNLYVAFTYPTDTWVSFKLFGLMGLTFAFTLGIGIWLARHMKEAGNG